MTILKKTRCPHSFKNSLGNHSLIYYQNVLLDSVFKMYYRKKEEKNVLSPG